MAEPIKRISVRIGGLCYQLVSAENENYTRQIAAKADEMIRRVMQNNPQLSLNMASVLALINSLDELARVYQQHNVLERQKMEADKQAGEARKELMRMREQNWEMKKEILRLNALQRDYEILLAKSPSAATASYAPHDQAAEVDYTDDQAYADESAGNARVSEPDHTQPERAQPAHTQPDRAQSDYAQSDHAQSTLTQTNLEDYLRENGWPRPLEQSSHAKPAGD